jgi:hypothetical protein
LKLEELFIHCLLTFSRNIFTVLGSTYFTVTLKPLHEIEIVAVDCQDLLEGRYLLVIDHIGIVRKVSPGQSSPFLQLVVWFFLVNKDVSCY